MIDEADPVRMEPDVSHAIDDNVAKVSELVRRESAKRTPLQRAIELVSLFFGEPRFLIGFLCACVAWIAADFVIHRAGYGYFDPPPF